VKKFLAGSLCAIIFLAIALAAYLALGFLDVAIDQRPSAGSGFHDGVAAGIRSAANRQAHPRHTGLSGLERPCSQYAWF
jgi:hypothetical protein